MLINLSVLLTAPHLDNMLGYELPHIVIHSRGDYLFLRPGYGTVYWDHRTTDDIDIDRERSERGGSPTAPLAGC